MKAGLNLYSVRNYLGTEESFLSVALDIKKMGYDYVQYSGGAFDANIIKRVSEKSGLPVVLTHVPMERIVSDTDALMDEHELFGCKNIGLGMMPKSVIADKTLCYETISALDEAGARMQKRGFKLFYHHHHFEFYRHDGKTVFDYILDNAPHVNFTLDTYWLQYGGADVCKSIDKARGRIECVHLKDYLIALKNDQSPEFEPVFAPVGDGSIDFSAVIERARLAGTKYFLVEQDNAAKLPDTLGQVERSIRYLKERF